MRVHPDQVFPKAQSRAHNHSTIPTRFRARLQRLRLAAKRPNGRLISVGQAQTAGMAKECDAVQRK
jgi:hypothetical protein